MQPQLSDGPAAARSGAGFWLSVNDLCTRWSCSRSYVYRRVLPDMERDGYLQRLFLGGDQRIALASILTYERAHATAPGVEAKRADVVELRQRNAPTRRQRRAVAPTHAHPSLRDAWKRMKTASCC